MVEKWVFGLELEIYSSRLPEPQKASCEECFHVFFLFCVCRSIPLAARRSSYVCARRFSFAPPFGARSTHRFWSERKTFSFSVGTNWLRERKNATHQQNRQIAAKYKLSSWLYRFGDSCDARFSCLYDSFWFDSVGFVRCCGSDRFCAFKFSVDKLWPIWQGLSTTIQLLIVTATNWFDVGEPLSLFGCADCNIGRWLKANDGFHFELNENQVAFVWWQLRRLKKVVDATPLCRSLQLSTGSIFLTSVRRLEFICRLNCHICLGIFFETKS